MLKRLRIKTKDKYKIELSQSLNKKPYIMVTSSEDNSIGIPLTPGQAFDLYKWLEGYLYNNTKRLS